MAESFRKILVTTDLSEVGNAAIPLAFRLARAESASVALVHVVEGLPPNPLYANYRPTRSPEERERAEAEARTTLAALVPSDTDVPHELHLLRGDPAAEICKAAEELGAGVIVISSHGRTGLKRVLLGSVATRVVQQAKCSVLVLRRT